MRRFAGVFAFFFAALVATGEIVVNPSDTTVTPGVWCGNFASAKSYAENNDCPMVLFWGKDGCDHCATLKSYLGTQAGLNWAASKNTTVFCLVEGTQTGADRDPNQGARDFAMGWNGQSAELMYTPFVCFYWPSRKTTRFSGWSGSQSDPTMTLSEFQSRYDDFVKDIVIEGSFASLPFGDYPCDRLEAIVGETTYVDVPVVRTNALNKTASAKVRFTSGLSSTDVSVSWAVDEKMKFARYQLPADVAVGNQITVELVDTNAKTLATRHIWCLAEAENSPKNPYWIGEKTTDTLAWGEWSMDLDVVTNKVTAWNAAHPGDRAYAMMFVGGSTWCPDCAMAEANFFSKQAFKDWAETHKVVFGILDIPNNPQAENAWPSQLRYESNRTSDAFVTLRGTAPADENERYQSGAGYLSRHSVAYTDALNIAERNAFLMGHDTLHGGWNRPERSNKNRTGVPVLILLRGDGTIAARWNRFSDVGPSAYHDGYLRRFEEMMALVDEQQEESNDDKSTTRETLATGDVVAATVSSVDQGDVYALSGFVTDDTVRLSVADGDCAPLKVSVIDGVSGTTVASATGTPKEGFVLLHKLGSSNYFVKIAPETIADGKDFGYTNLTSSVCSYSLSSKRVTSGGEIGFVASATNVYESCGTVALAVSRTRGSFGTASVKVKLVGKTGEGVDSRIAWTDTTLAWADGESGAKTAVLTILDDKTVRHDLQLTFALEELKGEAEDLTLTTDAMTVNVYDDEVFGIPAYRFVQVDERRPIASYVKDDTVTVDLASGKVPDGIVVTERDGQLRVTGTVSGAAGSYLAVYRIVCEGYGHTPTQEDMTLEFTVTDYDFAADIPSLATTRTHDNLPKIVQDGDVSLVAGLLTITVPANGQLSAKYVTQGQSFAYASEGWKTFDRDGGTLTAELFRTDDSKEILSVTLTKTGGTVQFADPVAAGTLTFALPAEIWPEGAGAYRGQYTVQLPQTNIVDGLGKDARAGAAYMALRMNSESAVAAGRMLYAGVLPNGRSFYACRTLAPDCCSVSSAVLPFYHYSDTKTSGYVFSGGLNILANAESLYKVWHWSVTENWTCVWAQNDAAGHESAFNVYGGYYDQDEIYDRFQEDFSGQLANFAFQVESHEIESGRYGSGASFAPVRAEITSDNTVRLVDDVANPHEVELSFSKETGVVSGNLYLPFEGEDVAVTFRGIVLPGWQGCGTCTTGSYVERPWAAGACSFSDRFKTIGAFRNGCAVSFDRVQ